MFVFGPIACLIILAFWNSPVYGNRLDCYSGFDSLPAFPYLFVVTAFNKLPHMDSNSASASSLQNTSPPMNPAEVSNLQAAFTYQSEMLKELPRTTNQAPIHQRTSNSLYPSTSTTHAEDGKLRPS